MTTQIILLIFIAALLAYIVYLHTRLVKKDLFIESTIKKLAGIEKSWSSEEIMIFLQELKKTDHRSSFFTDNLFEEKPIGFLLENQKDARIFIHYTKEEEDACNIIKEGFRFADSFYKTAIPVSDDRLDLLIKHNARKSFGDYAVILCISQKMFDHYTRELENRKLKEFAVENVLTEREPYINENADIIYLLSNKFVKGYINHQTGEIVSNPEFNPSFRSPRFDKNLDLLQQKSRKPTHAS